MRKFLCSIIAALSLTACPGIGSFNLKHKKGCKLASAINILEEFLEEE